MFTMLRLLSVLLPILHVHSLIQLDCNERTEYYEYNKCCKKCEPGKFMTKRCQPGPDDTKCETCGNGYFTEDYNTMYMSCKLCTKCSQEHMMYKRNCTRTYDAICTCVDGYTCKDSKCQTCMKIQTPDSTKPTPTPDNVWISVSLCFSCVCALFTCFLLISRHARPRKWIMSVSTGLCSSKKSNSGSSECTEEEEVPMPVQEMCGKTEKLEEV